MPCLKISLNLVKGISNETSWKDVSKYHVVGGWCDIGLYIGSPLLSVSISFFFFLVRARVSLVFLLLLIFDIGKVYKYTSDVYLL